MSDESEYLKDLRDASIKSAVEYLRVVLRLRELGGDLYCMDDPRPGGASRARGEQGSYAGDLLFDVTRLQLNTYNNLLGLSARYTERVVEGLRAVLQPSRTDRTLRHRRLAISGAAETVACAPHLIQIENDLPSCAKVTLSVSEFRSTAGGPPFGARVDIRLEPVGGVVDDERILEPREVRDFAVAIPLDPPFQPGGCYVADLYVIMEGRIVETIELRVEVLPR